MWMDEIRIPNIDERFNRFWKQIYFVICLYFVYFIE